MEDIKLSHLNIKEDIHDRFNIDIDRDIEDEQPNDEIKGRKIAFLKEFPVFSVKNKNTRPLIVEFSNGTKQIKFVPVDKYLKLIDKYVWNDPENGKDADVVTMEERMKHAAPYNVFFTTLKHCPETKEQLYSVNFTDLLCPSLGKLKCSFHITFNANIFWILEQFAKRRLHKLPMTIIHGYEGFVWPEKQTMEELYPKIDYHHIEIKEGALGCHHTKLSIYVYDDDSLRLVIGTANLFTEDWEIYNQQVWISPRCPKLPEGSSVIDGESPTGFKLALLDYMFDYKNKNIGSLDTWIERIKNTNFSDIKVALLFAVPGVHYPRTNGSFLHFLGHLLSRDCTIPAPKEEHDSWPIIALTSSLGLVGRTPDEWLTTHLLKALGSHKGSPYLATLRSVSRVKFNLIFPTVQNALDGYLGISSANCCPYEKGVKEAQPWLLKYTCQWKAEGTKRNRAMSHAKGYCRISPDSEKMVYYFLTSSNVSRSAWGKIPNQDSGVYIRSHEMGVLFLPKYFGEEYFEIKDVPDRKNGKLFPIMFDLPLTPYGIGDDSYCGEELAELGKYEYTSKLDFLRDLWDAYEEEHYGSEETDPPGAIGHTSSASTSRRKDVGLTPYWASNEITRKAANPYGHSPPVLAERRDMKYNSKPSTNMFFPDFKK